MKSLIKKLANTDIGILLRNSLNLRPLYLKHYKKNYQDKAKIIYYRWNF